MHVLHQSWCSEHLSQRRLQRSRGQGAMDVRVEQVGVRDTVLLKPVEEGCGRQLQLRQRHVHDALEAERHFAAARVRADGDVGV
eukprot:1241312-Pleurochrysis_carterae.AAC.7